MAAISGATTECAYNATDNAQEMSPTGPLRVESLGLEEIQNGSNSCCKFTQTMSLANQ